MTNFRPARVHISTTALQHNIKQIRSLAPDANIMAVIKADGYGHGMETVAAAISDHVEEFAVNSLDDVLRLRNAGFDKQLTVLSASLDKTSLLKFTELNTRVTIYDLSQLSLLEQIADNQNLSIWLKVDTGMGRLGILPKEFDVVISRLLQIKGLADISLMTHLANADQAENPANFKQIKLFEELAAKHPFERLSILNSAGLISYAEYAMDISRPGLSIYGISPTIGKSAEQLNFKPVMTFKSQLISIKRLSAGSAIGYGGTYVLDQDSRVGVIACGYGDGYPRHARNGTPVLVNGMLVPLIGRVSMDMICVDLGEIVAKVGDSVTLWGEANPIEVVADYAGTISYELCCGILPRVERIVD
ncbi:MAG: alanine racemase [Acidiferrobacterales bacterium]|nr:alanine racemase [Acidiferrobacterales bacterium]